jgi:hypothetical protein
MANDGDPEHGHGALFGRGTDLLRRVRGGLRHRSTRKERADCKQRRRYSMTHR